MEKIKKHIAIVIAITLLGELYFYPISGDFRFSIGVVALNIVLLVIDDFNEIKLSIFTGLSVLILRLFLGVNTSTQNTLEILISNLPASIYYIKDKTNASTNIDYSSLEVEDDDPEIIRASQLSKAFFTIVIAMGIGTLVTMLIGKTGLVIPGYIGAIFVAAIIRNIADGKKIELPHAEISVLGNIFLSVFLAMTIMSLEIWKIAGMALPLITILIGQVILLVIFDIFVVFRAAGKDYDSAVMTAGFYGYAMGATPNAMASMSAVVGKYGRPSPKAYFTIPIVGGFIIDLTMSLLVIGHMNLILAGIL